MRYRKRLNFKVNRKHAPCRTMAELNSLQHSPEALSDSTPANSPTEDEFVPYLDFSKIKNADGAIDTSSEFNNDPAYSVVENEKVPAPTEDSSDLLIRMENILKNIDTIKLSIDKLETELYDMMLEVNRYCIYSGDDYLPADTDGDGFIPFPAYQYNQITHELEISNLRAAIEEYNEEYPNRYGTFKYTFINK